MVRDREGLPARGMLAKYKAARRRAARVPPEYPYAAKLLEFWMERIDSGRGTDLFTHEYLMEHFPDAVDRFGRDPVTFDIEAKGFLKAKEWAALEPDTLEYEVTNGLIYRDLAGLNVGLGFGKQNAKEHLNG
jgi:hypothetical protein